MHYDVIVVGAGLAGLSAAVHLHRRGVNFALLEAGDRVGGRVKTDQYEGFLLDHGFQIFLTAYPEAKALLDYPSLHLREFYKGALIRTEAGLQKVGDPLKHPFDIVQTLNTSVGTFGDKLKIAELMGRVLSQGEGRLDARPEMTTVAYLKAHGFSDAIIDRFFRPFFSGIFLESELATSSRLFEFLFRTFATGNATLPAAGMQAIPDQLLALLPERMVQLNARVSAIVGQKLTLASGETIRAEKILIAGDALDAQALLPELPTRVFHPVHCLYFAADQPPVERPVLVLNGMMNAQSALVNHLCVPSLVSPTYAPPGKHLISVSLLGQRENVHTLFSAAQAELAGWFGPQVNDWQFLKAYSIRKALPRLTVPQHSMTLRTARFNEHVYLAGDYLESPSFNGALGSGRRAAEAILQDLKMPVA